MDPEFRFEGGSSDEETEREVPALQSPWEFGSYSESVDEEHARRRTTSIDAKISKALHDRPVSLPDHEDEDDDSGGDNEDDAENEDGEENEGEEKGGGHPEDEVIDDKNSKKVIST